MSAFVSMMMMIHPHHPHTDHHHRCCHHLLDHRHLCHCHSFRRHLRPRRRHHRQTLHRLVFGQPSASLKMKTLKTLRRMKVSTICVVDRDLASSAAHLHQQRLCRRLRCRYSQHRHPRRNHHHRHHQIPPGLAVCKRHSQKIKIAIYAQ